VSHTTNIKSVPILSVTALRRAVQELQEAGVACSLVENAVPRMFYQNQLQKHLGRESDVCDFVLRLDRSRYDVGFFRNAAGALEPVFDDWQKDVAKQIGAPFAGKVEHWSGNRDDTEQTLHSIGGLLQRYTKHATMEAAAAAGYICTGTRTTEDGKLQLIFQT
jgi:hypothetical protein